MALRYRGPKWRFEHGPPPFRDGDMITPRADKYNYTGRQHDWPRGVYRKVEAVMLHDEGYYTLRVWNPAMEKYSEYNPNNFEVMEAQMAAFERTKYIGIALGPSGDLDFTESRQKTPWRDTKHEVRSDIAKEIGAGDRWVVLQTVMMIEGEEPRPPIKITEYR